MGGKFHAPVADGGVSDLDIKGGLEDQADITERVLAEIKHG